MKSLFFDLDGTLIDSKLDIANSVNAAFKHFNLTKLDNETIYEFVGTGVKQLLIDCLNYQNRLHLFDEFFDYFLNHYYSHLLDNTRLYDGVDSLLQTIYQENKLFIVTNKSAKFTHKIIKDLKIDQYFADVVSGDTFENKKPHPEPILKLREKHNINLDDSIFIGDSESDIIAAKSTGVRIVWVSYGFRDKKYILSNYSVDYIIDKPMQLLPILSKIHHNN